MGKMGKTVTREDQRGTYTASIGSYEVSVEYGWDKLELKPIGYSGHVKEDNTSVAKFTIGNGMSLTLTDYTKVAAVASAIGEAIESLEASM